MTAKVLVVDDEPDLEDLVRQRFRRQIKEGSIAFGFARDGVEALALLAEQGDFDMVVSDINMPRMDGLTLARQAARRGDEVLDRDRLRLWRHGQYPHGHEPGRVRLPDQAN
jgi:adenylate cyclase